MIVIFLFVLILWAFVCCVVIGLGIEKWWHERKNTTTLTVAEGSRLYAGMRIVIDPNMPNEEMVRVVSVDGNTVTIKR